MNRVRDYQYLSAAKISQRYLQQAPPPAMTREWGRRPQGGDGRGPPHGS
jgi:hypothetical protein